MEWLLSLLGAVVGGIISLGGILITNHYSLVRAREDRVLERRQISIDSYVVPRREVLLAYAAALGAYSTTPYNKDVIAQYMSAYNKACVYVSSETRGAMLAANNFISSRCSSLNAHENPGITLNDENFSHLLALLSNEIARTDIHA